jgi:hypothetical protein
MNEGIASGEVQPLPWTAFARSKAQDAFRYLAGGKTVALCSCQRQMCAVVSSP